MKMIFKNLLFVSILVLLPLSALWGQSLPGSNTLYLEALKYYNLQKDSEAKTLFTEIIAKEPSNDAAYYYLSKIYLRLDEPEMAEKMMLAAVEADNSNTWYKSSLADIYVILDKPAQAIEIYNALKKNDPMNVEFSEKLIGIYVATSDFQKAMETLEEIEGHIGRSELTGLFRYNLLMYQNKRDEAISFMEELNSDLGTSRTATILGDYNADRERDSTALVYYNQALSIDPNYIPAIFGIAEVYRAMRHYDLYFDKINTFLASNDVIASMKSDYIKQILSNQQFVVIFQPQVDTMMRTLYAANYQDSTITSDYGIFMAQTGNTGEALSAFKDNTDRHPGSKSILVNYLSYLYYLNDFFSLLDESELSIKNHFATDPDILQFKAFAHFNLGDIKNSIASFKEILKYSQNQDMTVSTLTTLGDLNYEVKNKKEAYKYYQKALKIDPKYVAALNNYAYYLSLDGKKLKQAKEMSKITIEAEPNNPTYLDTYAWILHIMGDHAGARDIFKHAMLYGAKENANILDHYADVLYALNEHELAFIYWKQADDLDPSLGINAKVEKIRGETKK